MGIPNRRKMAIRLPANLHRNRHGVLYFRIGVPQDLRRYFNTAEIYKSLKTASVKDASHHAQALSAAFKRTFLRIRQSSMLPIKKSPTEAYEEFLHLPDLRLRLRAAGKQVMLEEQDAELARLENEIINIDERRRHEEASFERTLDRLGKSITPNPTAQSIGDGRNISAYVAPYIESIRSGRKRPLEKTIKSYEVSASLFVEIIGDKPLHELDHNDRNHYDETIFKVPKNRQKMPATRGKAIAEILNMPGLKLMSSTTVKDEGLRTNLFLSWVFHKEGKPTPFSLLERFKVDKSEAQKRRLFMDAELQLVFNPATLGVDLRPSPYKYWLTLIGLHTGARIDEIAQLGLSDIISIDGIDCFSITPIDDPQVKRSLASHVKSDAGKRVVPIHSRPIELGLLNYVHELQSEGYRMLFPDLAHAKITYGSLASKWFGRYCDGLGLTDPDIVFHSFRHGVITHLRKKKVERELCIAIVGHSHLKDTLDIYIHVENMYDLNDKKEAIELLDFSNAVDYAALMLRTPKMTDLKSAMAQKVIT